jgi:hypothetical protein
MTERPVPKNRPTILSLATSDGVPKAALIAALVVGTILNLINQGEALCSGGELNFLKLGLTYLVPYCVATYGAVTARRRFMTMNLPVDASPRRESAADSD